MPRLAFYPPSPPISDVKGGNGSEAVACYFGEYDKSRRGGPVSARISTKSGQHIQITWVGHRE